MDTFGNRLKQLREKKGISQEELAKLFNLSQSTIAYYEKDKKQPSHKTLSRLSDFFGVSTDYILGRIDTPIALKDILEKIENHIPLTMEEDEYFTPVLEAFKVNYLYKQSLINTNISIPLLGTIRAGLPILAEENIEGYMEVPKNIIADYILRVQGDSMIGAGILDGDLAICRETNVPQSGQIIVALRDEGSLSEATLKFYMNGNGNPCLRAANPSFLDMDYKNGYRTAGTMVALVRSDMPGYQVYKNYIAVPGYDEWTEVIETANQAGLKVNQVKEILAGQIDIAKKLRGLN